MNEQMNDIKHNTYPLMIERSFYLETENYTEILKYYNLKYKVADYYLQSGEIIQVQGWILHISVIISQVMNLLETILPLLKSENVAFKIPMDKETASNLLNGNLGVNQLGKIVSIYPATDNIALSLAKKLIELTRCFKGINIPTDVMLGSVVYTRYGSFNPIILTDNNGKANKYIYDTNGNLIQDPYSIPFQLPDKVQWPFQALASPVIPPTPKILNNIYRPISSLKNDHRGNVFVGFFLKNLFHVKKCVIKQGFKNMLSEDSGRDIHDRLVWQKDLHDELTGIIPVPKIIDLFKEKGDTYLVMEYIKGHSLYDHIRRINFNRKSWIQLTRSERLELIECLLKVISPIELLHQKGYVHRDIVPGNFIIDQRMKVVLIDMELSYSLQKNMPNPPYKFGTPGFMSPEQKETQTPTIKEDIYGLGALMITIFTGLSPMKFDTSNLITLSSNLAFFIGNQVIADLITTCMNCVPKNRPTIPDIRTTLEKYKQELQSSETFINTRFDPTSTFSLQLREIINDALNGLTKPPIVMLNDLWCSKSTKKITEGDHHQKEYSRYCGLYEGICGVLYLLAKAKKVGFNIDSCKKSYEKSWEFINEDYLKLLPHINPGLYGGAAGIALSLAEGISTGLIDDSLMNCQTIQKCLSLQNTDLDFATGITGQSIAILQCAAYLDKTTAQQILEKNIEILIDTQQRDGSWKFPSHLKNNQVEKKLSFGFGITGIIWLLLEYQSPRSLEASLKALKWLLKRTNNLGALFTEGFLKNICPDEPGKGSVRKDIILLCIKAYETFHDNHYKKIAEESLTKYPTYSVKNDFSQNSGLAAMGELYLEATRVFENDQWQNRADWIANVYTHTLYRNLDKSGYWIIEEHANLTADFMVGISGIIHFLMRYLEPQKIGYRLLK